VPHTAWPGSVVAQDYDALSWDLVSTATERRPYGVGDLRKDVGDLFQCLLLLHEQALSLWVSVL
jgi:hypothetical protein